MKVEKYTRKNANGTFRIPLTGDYEFRIEAGRLNQAMFGDFINALGAYEDSGLSPEEAEKLGKIGKDRLQLALDRAGVGITL